MYVGLFMKHKMFEVYLALYTTIRFIQRAYSVYMSPEWIHVNCEFILIVNEMNFHIILDETNVDKIPKVITFKIEGKLSPSSQLNVCILHLFTLSTVKVVISFMQWGKCTLVMRCA